MGILLDITNISLGEIDRIELSSWLVDLDKQKVVAGIGELSTTGERVRDFEVTFWVTLPDEVEILDDEGLPTGETIPNPVTWYALPAGTITELTDLSNQILSAVKGRVYA